MTYRRYSNRPSRAEINAAHRLYAPFNLKGKEKEMATQTKEKTKGTELTRQAPAPLAQVDESELDIINEDAMRELVHYERELSVGFKHTSASDLLKRDEAFSIIDAIITTMDEDVERVENGQRITVTEERPKIVWVLQFPSGEVATCMQSYGNIRAKWANYFEAAWAKGKKVEAGPVKFAQMTPRKKQPQDAVVFVAQPGFKFSHPA